MVFVFVNTIALSLALQKNASWEKMMKMIFTMNSKLLIPKLGRLRFFAIRTTNSTQHAPGIFNLDQKIHGFSYFWGIYIYETVQNQSRKTSLIRLPKFTIVDIAGKCHQYASCFLRLLL